MSFCRLMPFFIVASAIVGGVIAWAVGAHISYGVAVGMAVGFSPIPLLGLLVGLLHLWRPGHPRCLCGGRRYNYVTTIKPAEEDTSTWAYHYRCLRCGRDFVGSRHAFQAVGEDGAPVPYMTHSEWGRWRPAGG